MTDVKALYYKERRRAQRAIRKAQKEGYDVNISLPKIPKKITQGSVRRLREKFSTKEINRRSTKVVEDGVVISRQQNIVRSRWKKKDTPTPPPAEPLPPSEPEDGYDEPILSEIDILVNKVWERIDNIPSYNIPTFSQASYEILSKAFQDYVDQLQHATKEQTEEIVSQLKGILEEEVLNITYFESDEVKTSAHLAEDLRQMGDRIGSKELLDLSEQITDEEEFVEVSPEFMKQYGWMF